MASKKKEKILESTIYLLENCQNPKEVTTRCIADQAEVNSAMINYYFGSKDNLIVDAMRHIISGFLEDSVEYNSGNPKKALEDIFMSFAQKILVFRKHLRAAVPTILLDDEVTLSRKILPLIQEYYGNNLLEVEAKMLAYKTVSFMLLVFYRSEAVKSYCGLDVMKDDECRTLIRSEVNLVLNKSYPKYISSPFGSDTKAY